MIKRLKFRLVLTVSLFIFIAAGAAVAQTDSSRWLVSPELLRAGGLEIVWDNVLAIGKKESLARLFVLGNRIYAFSDRNYIISLDGENGKVVFERYVAEVGFPILGLELYNGELLSLIGNKLVEMDSELGTERNVTALKFSVTCPAVRNSSYFYVAGSDRRMHVLRAEDKVQVFEVAAEDDSMITSVVADERFVIFATDAGCVIGIMPDRPRRLWPRFDAAERIVGSMVRDGGWLFFASEDTNVYKVGISTGKLGWKYPAGAVLDRGPCVTGEIVYQYVRYKGLAAIDKKSGKLIWQLAEGLDLLAEVNDKAYVITDVGTLVVMDNKEARQLYSVNFAAVSRYAVNVADSKIYIADKGGRIACLRPIE